jgi:signal peptidase I
LKTDAARPGIVSEFLDSFPRVMGPRIWVYVRLVLGLIFGWACICSSIVSWGFVPSASMAPTLLVGDRVLVNRVAYDLKLPFAMVRLVRIADPKRNDVVVFDSPVDGLPLVKRVIGLPGDTIELRNRVVYVNGTAAEYGPSSSAPAPTAHSPAGAAERVLTERIAPSLEPHEIIETSLLQTIRSFPPIHIPAGRYLVLGDNRDRSFDSRYFGLVDRSRIVGRAAFVLFSSGGPSLHPWGRLLCPVR